MTAHAYVKQFEVRSPHRKPLDYSAMTREQFDAEMEKGIASINAGRITSAEQVREEMQR